MALETLALAFGGSPVEPVRGKRKRILRGGPVQIAHFENRILHMGGYHIQIIRIESQKFQLGHALFP
ncbi:hypothetical protein D3C87_1593790 [compost metagenome]